MGFFKSHYSPTPDIRNIFEFSAWKPDMKGKGLTGGRVFNLFGFAVLLRMNKTFCYSTVIDLFRLIDFN